MVFQTIASFLVGLSGLTGRAAEVANFWIYDTLKISSILFAMVLFIGLIRTYISPEKIRKYLEGRKSITGYFLAAVLGVVSPFCSCSTIPIFMGFTQAGIPLGMTLTFLFVSPMVNTAAVVVLLSTLGLSQAALYITSGIIVGVSGGYMLSRMFGQEDTGAEKSGKGLSETPRMKERWKKAYFEARGIVRDVMPYIVIGVGIGALIHGLVPENFIAKYLSGTLAVPGAVLLGVPVYTNIMGVIPVVGSLLGKGLPIGTGIAFMMSVTALSLPQFFMLKKVMSRKLLITYGLTMSAGIILVGYIGNILL